MLTPNYYGTELDEQGLKMLERAMTKPITMDEIQMLQELEQQQEEYAYKKQMEEQGGDMLGAGLNDYGNQ